MHESSLSSNIIEIVEDSARNNNVSKVSEIVLEIGTLSGVEIDALDMALQSLQSGSVLEGSTIKKDIVKAVAQCSECGEEFTPDDFFCACPKCGSFAHTVLKGKELRVRSIVAE